MIMAFSVSVSYYSKPINSGMAHVIKCFCHLFFWHDGFFALRALKPKEEINHSCVLFMLAFPLSLQRKIAGFPWQILGKPFSGKEFLGHEIFCRKFLFSNRHLNGGKMNVSAKKAENSLAKCKMPSDLCYAFEKKTSNISLLSDGANFFWVPLILPLQLPFFPPVNFLVLLTMPL